MTNVPGPTFGPTGFVAPTEAEILAGVRADINEAFGGGLNPAPETPQGQLAVSEAAVLGRANDMFVELSNGVDPAYATGRMQDAIGRFYFLRRIGSQPTVVVGLCTGLAGVVIPAGSLAQADDDSIFASDQEAAIGLDGTVEVQFSCVTPGPVACPAGSLTRIYRAINGWDTITNEEDGVLGRDTEKRAAFEARRAASVAKNAVGVLGAIRGELLDTVAGVLDVYVTDNDEATPVVKGGVTIEGNSLYVAVVGGTNQDVAEAIWRKKNPGSVYTGNTVVTVYDTNQGYNPPYPSYTVKFQRPTSLTVVFRVKLRNNALIPADALTQIAAALTAAFAGDDDGQRAVIGETLLASRFYAPIAALGSWAQILSIEVASINAPKASFTASMAGTNMTVSAVASGALAAGQTVIADGVAAGVTIVSQSSGSAGGTGVYVISLAQTVSSRAMKSVLADADSVAVNIDQAPTFTDANLSLVLV